MSEADILDYSSPNTINPAVAKAAGFGGTIRYLGGWGRLQPAERDAWLAAGLLLGLVWEQNPDDPLHGAWLGEQHARQAVAEAAALFPGGGGVIFGACDTDPRRNRNAVIDYYRAWSPIIRASNNDSGGYLGDDPGVLLLDNGTLDVLWQPSATSWSANYPSARAHVVQRLGQPVDLGAAYDYNTVQAPFRAWGKTAPAPPTPKGEDMIYQVTDPVGTDPSPDGYTSITGTYWHDGDTRWLDSPGPQPGEIVVPIEGTVFVAIRREKLDRNKAALVVLGTAPPAAAGATAAQVDAVKSFAAAVTKASTDLVAAFPQE